MLTITFISLQNSFPILSYGYLSAYFRKYSKHSSKVIFKTIDCSPSFNYKSNRQINNLINKIKNSDIVGLSTITQDYNKILALSKSIKHKLNIPIIFGGHHISALPETLPDFVDVGVIGEGEQSFLDIIDSFIENNKFDPDKLKNISGIVFRKNNKVIISRKRDLINNLDSIPIPDRSIFDKKYFQPKAGWSENTELTGKIIANISISRGCPYSCIFCSSSKQWGNSIRFFSINRVVDEIEELVNSYNVRIVQITDDLISIDASRLESLYNLLEEKRLLSKIEFGAIQIRANLLSENLCKILKKIKITTLGMGIETGSNKTLKFLKGENISVENNLKAVKLAYLYGFKVWPQLIVGIPGETREDIENTLKFCSQEAVEYYQITMLTPLPGTGLWEYALSKGLVSNNMNWDRLSLNLNQKSQIKRVYLGTHISENEAWKMISPYLARLQRKKALNYKIDIRKNAFRYIKSFISDPFRYLRLIFNVLFVKIVHKVKGIA